MGTDPITRVKESDGDLVLDYPSRVGARPYARYVGGEWDVMSLSHVPTRWYGQADTSDVGHDTRVHTVDLAPEDINEEVLREMAHYPRYPNEDNEEPPEWLGVEVIGYDESPFPDREEIPLREDIVRVVACGACGEEFRQYLPEPFEECPNCEVPIDLPGE